MNKPSSTITAAGGFGFLGVLLLGAVNVFWPEIYQRMNEVPMFTESLVLAIGTVAGYFKKEKVLNVQPRT